MSCLRRTFAGQPKISKKVSQAPKAQTYELSKDYSKLIFDDSGRALIFSHLNGEMHLGWTMRLAVMVGCLSMWLLMMEIKDPLFGFGSKIGFGMLTFISMGLLPAANIYGRKIISKIWLHKNGDKVDVVFFSAFGTPRILKASISEFNGAKASYAGFVVTEALRDGKVWYYPEANEFREFGDYDVIVEQIVDGQSFDFKKLERRVQRFK
jgi:hypothetical protein